MRNRRLRDRPDQWGDRFPAWAKYVGLAVLALIAVAVSLLALNK